MRPPRLILIQINGSMARRNTARLIFIVQHCGLTSSFIFVLTRVRVRCLLGQETTRRRAIKRIKNL